MAEIYDFDNRLATVKKITKDAAQWAEAAQAAEYFAKAADALQMEYQPADLSSKANKFYFALIRDYFLSAADDIEEFADDDGTFG